MYLWKENRCLHAICHDSIVIHTLSMHQQLNEQLASRISCHFRQLFIGVTNTTSTPIRMEGRGWWRATKWQAKAMSTLKQPNGSICVIISTHISHKAANYYINPWQNSPASQVVIYSSLCTCSGEMEPIKDCLSTHGHLTSLRKKPQIKQPRQLSAPIPA